MKRRSLSVGPLQSQPTVPTTRSYAPRLGSTVRDARTLREAVVDGKDGQRRACEGQPRASNEFQAVHDTLRFSSVAVLLSERLGARSTPGGEAMARKRSGSEGALVRERAEDSRRQPAQLESVERKR